MMSQVPGKARDRKFNFYVEQHFNKYANRLNRTIVRPSDFELLRTDISAESVHEA